MSYPHATSAYAKINERLTLASVVVVVASGIALGDMELLIAPL